MTQAIPASQFTSTTAGVISAGGLINSQNSIWLTNNTAVPIGQLQQFPSYSAVANFFGATNTESQLAAVYFAGFDNSNTKPGQLTFAQFPLAPVAAYLRSGLVNQMTMAQLGALSGTLIITVDGVVKTSATINLTGVSSFSAAATLIKAGFVTNPPNVTYDSQRGGFLITSPTVGSGAVVNATTATSTSVTINSVTSGTVQIGQIIVGSGIPAGAYIVSFGTFTVLAGTGTVIISAAATTTVTNAVVSMNASSITYATGTLSTSLLFTQATYAVLSQGAEIAAVPTFMNNIVNQFTNWIPLMTMWEPSLPLKEQFAAWFNTQFNYLYVCYDSDSTPKANYNAPASFGNIMQTNQNVGVMPIWGTADKAAFVCGAIASVDYNERNGWVDYAYKHQSGLVPDITDQTSYQNLIANGYNCYAEVTLDLVNWNFLQPGSIPGEWLWLDNYIDKIIMLKMIQMADLTLLSNLKALPADQAGIEILRQSTMVPINQMLDFGAIQTGITLTLAQISEVNFAAGLPIDGAIFNNGYYLQIIPSQGATRQARVQSRTLWYTGAMGINTLQLSALDVQ